MCDVEKLISAVEKRHAIYDASTKKHSDKNLIEKLWDDVAYEIHSNSADCKAKWSTLRNTYARHLRLEKLPSGSAATNRKKWYLADAMSFVEKHMNIHRTSGTSNASTDEETDAMTVSQPSPTASELKICSSNSEIFQSNRTKKRKCNGEMQPIMDYFKARTNEMLASDSHLKFFQSLLPDVRKLSEEKQRHFKFKVHELLNSLLEEGSDVVAIHL